METFRQDIFTRETGHAGGFVQDNRSVSKSAATLRGLHAQIPPKAQGKLISVIQGAIFDVAVDARKGSDTYGQHVALKLAPQRGAHFWVPPGFLHGFLTLTPDTIVSYKCTDYYDASCEVTLAWDDPDLAIDWGSDAPALSDKDGRGLSFANFKSPF